MTDDPICTVCGDPVPVVEAGPLTIEPSFCDECLSPNDREASDVEKERAYRESIRNSNLPKRFRQERVELHPKVREWLYRTYPRPDHGMFLCGETGSGKTAQACSAGLAYIESAVRTDGQPVDVLFASTPELMDDRRPGGEETEYTLKRIKNADLFILDDLGKEKGTDYTRKTLFSITNVRIETARPTILTSNASIESLAQDELIDPPTKRRIREMCGGDQWYGRLKRGWWQ